MPGMKKIWRWKTREVHPCHFNPKNIIPIFFQNFAFSLLDLLYHRHFHPSSPDFSILCKFGAYFEQNLEQCDALAGFFGIYGLAWLHFRFASTLSYYYTTLYYLLCRLKTVIDMNSMAFHFLLNKNILKVWMIKCQPNW